MNNVPIDGVPKNLKNTVFPFSYNNFEELKTIVEKNDIGVIKWRLKEIVKEKMKARRDRRINGG